MSSSYEFVRGSRHLIDGKASTDDIRQTLGVSGSPA